MEKSQLVRWSIMLLFLISILYLGEAVASISLGKAPDFTVFYGTARNILNGTNPYEDPTLFTGLGYPIVTGLGYVPFLLFPYTAAQTLFTVLSIVSIFLSLYVILKHLQVKSLSFAVLLFTPFIVFSFPTQFTLGMGQSNFLAYAILLYSFHLFTQKKLYKGGILFGIAVIIKPLFIVLTLFFLLRKSWKFLFVTSSTVCIFVGITILSYGITIYIYYLTELIPHLLKISGREVYYNQGITGFVARLIPDLAVRKMTANIISLSLLFFSLVWMRMRRFSDTAAFNLLLVVLVLVDSLAWQHHFVFLIFPFITLSMRFWRQKNYTFLGVLFFSYLLISINIELPQKIAFIPFLSHGFYGAVLLLTLALFSLGESEPFKKMSRTNNARLNYNR
ncbi:MAG: DUF2029 domain-containing protein [Candidatus Levybacteria bacterium]|nr:DUF2029 domain-containing protein [Candidatus Levybacteria bacterium]